MIVFSCTYSEVRPARSKMTLLVFLLHIIGHMELQVDASAGRTVVCEGGLVLQGGPAREEGVLEVVVEHAADGGHVDVSKAREATGEVSGVVVGPEKTPELPVEDILCLRPARTHRYINTGSDKRPEQIV